MKNLSYLINMASKQLKSKLDNALKEFDITAAQFSVIMQIHTAENPITAAEIAHTLGADRPTISGIINRLEKKHIILKVDNPQDKRSCYLNLNEDAKSLVIQMKTVSDELTEDTFSIFTPEEAKEFMKFILRLIAKTQE